MTQSKQEAQARMFSELRALQHDLTENWLDRSLPAEWDGLDTAQPLKQVKDRVTIRLDADMLRWFRRLGPGYGQRINRVLRVYWTALVSGQIKSHWDEEELSPPFMQVIERAAAKSDGDEDGAGGAQSSGDVMAPGYRPGE
jgi:uncharacterized protein (DUF4415 family)